MPQAKCTKCQITMAHKKHHKKHAHKSRRRGRVGAFSKFNVMDVAVTGLSAVAGYYISDRLAAMVPAGTDPLYTNLGKIAVGVAAGAFAPGGTAGKVVSGLGVGMIASGGSKIAKHYIDGTPLVAGTLSRPVLSTNPTIGGYKHRRIAGTGSQPVAFTGSTIGSASQLRAVAL